MASSPSPGGGRIRCLSRTEKRARELLRHPLHCGNLVEASILCALGQLLEKIWEGDGEAGLAELNTVSAVLQRLLSSIQQAGELRQRMGNGSLCRDLGSLPEGDGLPAALIGQLEERLRLL